MDEIKAAISKLAEKVYTIEKNAAHDLEVFEGLAKDLRIPIEKLADRVKASETRIGAVERAWESLARRPAPREDTPETVPEGASKIVRPMASPEGDSWIENLIAQVNAAAGKTIIPISELDQIPRVVDSLRWAWDAGWREAGPG